METTPRKRGRPTQNTEPVNWDAVEVHYKRGVMGINELCDRFKISNSTLYNHVKKRGWVRDKAAEVRAKSDAKIDRAISSVSVFVSSKNTAKFEEEVAVEVMTRIRMDHRRQIARYRGLCETLLAELEQHTVYLAQYGTLAQVLKQAGAGDIVGAEANLRAVLSLPERSKTMKTLIDAFSTLIRLEREAVGIVDGPDKPVLNIINNVHTMRAPSVDAMEASRVYAEIMQGGGS